MNRQSLNQQTPSGGATAAAAANKTLEDEIEEFAESIDQLEQSNLLLTAEKDSPMTSILKTTGVAMESGGGGEMEVEESIPALAPKRLDYCEEDDDEGGEENKVHAAAVIVRESPMEPAAAVKVKAEEKATATPKPVPEIFVTPATEVAKVSEKEKAVQSYTNLLNESKKKLTDLSQKWEIKMEDFNNGAGGPTGLTEQAEEEVKGQIRATIGKATILMNQKGKFHQFQQLIDNCQYGRGEKETKHTDLAGFWDMVYYQVVDIDCEFKKLDELEKAGWRAEKPEKPVVASKANKAKKKAAGGGCGKRAGPSNRLREMMAARRKELSETKKAAAAAAVKVDDGGGMNVFDGGFFKVKSPTDKPPVKRLSIATPKTPAGRGAGVASGAAAATPRSAGSSNPTTPMLLMRVSKAT